MKASRTTPGRDWAGTILLLGLLTACSPRPGWRVQELEDAGLPRRKAADLERCAALLGIGAERSAPADVTNYGERQDRDTYGRRVPHRPQLIVLHETVLSSPATVRLFQTPHPKDDDQVSYHLLINRDGDRLRIVPDERRAFGAGVSAFGDMTVRIRPSSLGSINNVALHLSLETPPDGRGDGDAHSGYTPAQYRTAAQQVLLWQARHGIPFSRITTHGAVDRSRTRYDPRSFRWDRFEAAYGAAANRCGFRDYLRRGATW